MKNLRLLFTISVLALLTACGTTKTTSDTANSSTRRGDTQTTRTNTNTSTSTNTTRSTKVSGTRGASNMESSNAEQMKANEEAYKAYTAKMYSDLNLTTTQSNSFETKWNAERSKWMRANANKEMTLYERVETQDRIFRNILNDEEFAKYQAWVRDNPGNFK